MKEGANGSTYKDKGGFVIILDLSSTDLNTSINNIEDLKAGDFIDN